MYRHILTRKESDIIRSMAAGEDYSGLELATLARLTPSEVSVLVDGLTRRNVLAAGGEASRVKLTPSGIELRNNLLQDSTAPSQRISVMVTDDASAERMEKNLGSGHLEADLESYIQGLK